MFDEDSNPGFRRIQPVWIPLPCTLPITPIDPVMIFETVDLLFIRFRGVILILSYPNPPHTGKGDSPACGHGGPRRGSNHHLAPPSVPEEDGIRKISRFSSACTCSPTNRLPPTSDDLLSPQQWEIKRCPSLCSFGTFPSDVG